MNGRAPEIIPIHLGTDSYDIVLKRGGLGEAAARWNLRRKVLIVTDDGVPAAYAKTLAGQCAEAEIVCLPRGEQTKSMENFRLLLSRMLAFGMSRGDCVAAVGGGVPGDLAGFAAACYMRGIDFYNCPTTVLSQVDSSIGGKTAIDLDGIKNVVGAFHQPRGVLIDPDLLATLPPRQVANGLAEAVKMALCFSEADFALFEEERPEARLDRLIANAVRTKKQVVEQDEKEQGLRRVLNFGHTLGHGIESLQGEDGLVHGECVALGMLPMCGTEVRERLKAVLRKLGLPAACGADADRVMQAVAHDKKSMAGKIICVLCEKPGSYSLQPMTAEELRERYCAAFGGKKK